MSMTKIAEITVGAGGSTVINLTNIPQIYTDLILTRSMRSDGTAGPAMSANITFNNSTTGYSERLIYSNTTGTISTGSRSGSFLDWVGMTPASGTGTTASTFGVSGAYITNYTGTSVKNIVSDSTQESNTTNGAYWNFYSVAASWSGSEPVTSITLTSTSGNFVQGSSIALYGVTKVPSQGIQPKATGGSIYQNGAYTYHVFSASGTFTPTTAIPNAEMLIVAGGAGGGRGDNGGGGGGGAGQVLNLTSQSMTATPYTVTIGAGGGQSTAGASSSISGFTAATGGGVQPSISGGGGTGGTSGNGYAGGAGGSFSGGGGGGAAGAGSSYNSGNSNPGPGGPATYAYATWTQATNTGYGDGFSGGGGGGSYWGTVTRASGGGAGAGYGGYGGNAAGSASANTGSGGGGNDQVNTAGSGGSGIVIIRYA